MSGVLGVDGGQSGIRLRHSDGPRVVELDGISRQEGDTVAAVGAAVAEGWRDAGFPAVDRVVLGLTTAPAGALEADRLCALVAAATGAAEIWLADDAVTAHAGALGGCPGVAVVAGTGVACLALPEHGPARIVGGHGFLLGDEGGAFWIGRRGLAAALRSVDGRGTATALATAAEGRFGSLADVHVRVHDARRPVDAIARFAPAVLDAAAAGDAVAGGIVDDAAAELLLLIEAAIRGAGGGPLPVRLGGRMLEAGTELRRRLDARLAAAEPPVDAASAAGSALDGAIGLGLAGTHRYGALVHAWLAGGAA